MSRVQCISAHLSNTQNAYPCVTKFPSIIYFTALHLLLINIPPAPPTLAFSSAPLCIFFYCLKQPWEKKVLLGWDHVTTKADFAIQKCPIKMGSCFLNDSGSLWFSSQYLNRLS